MKRIILNKDIASLVR